jgi:hypothetical protein
MAGVSPRHLLSLAIASLLLAGCGVSFGSDQGNEFFKSIDVSGRMEAGAPLTVAVTYEQFYPFQLDIECELWDNTTKTLVRSLGQDLIPSYPEGSPRVTPFPGNFSMDFVVEEPGEYLVECFTVLDDENFIGEKITIREADRD